MIWCDRVLGNRLLHFDNSIRVETQRPSAILGEFAVGVHDANDNVSETFRDEFSESSGHLGAVDAARFDHQTEHRVSTSITTAIQSYLDSVEIGDEHVPADVGSIKTLERRTVINAALALAIAKAVRCCKRNSNLTCGLLFYVAVRSDNVHGRCTDSAQRMAEYLNCSEDVARDTRDALVLCGALRAERRAGQAVTLWLPYIRETLLYSDFAILKTLAPPRLGPGRPRKVKTSGATHPTISEKTVGDRHPPISEKTSGVCNPPIFEKPRVFSAKTPGVEYENPGRLTPDSKNSIQELNSRSQGESRVRATTTLTLPTVVNKFDLDALSGAELVWRALEGQGLQRSRDMNVPEMKTTLSSCRWISQLLPDEAHELAAVAAKAMAATNKGFWPTTTELSECAETYFKERHFQKIAMRDYADAMEQYEKLIEAREAARVPAAQIAAQFPEPAPVQPDFSDWHKVPSSDRAAQTKIREAWAQHYTELNRREWREKIRNAQIAAGLELLNGPEPTPPTKPIETDIGFVWPTRGRSKSLLASLRSRASVHEHGDGM